MTILNEILKGVPEARKNKFHIEKNREKAIGKAIQNAKTGDIILIAGKGHETTQQIDDRILPFQDSAVAKVALEHFKKS